MLDDSFLFTYLYLIAINEKIIMSTIIRPAYRNKLYDYQHKTNTSVRIYFSGPEILTWRSKGTAASMMMTIRFPKALVRSQQACITDFMLEGACEYANSKPVMENMISPIVMMMYCGSCSSMWMLLGGVTSLTCAS